MTQWPWPSDITTPARATSLCLQLKLAEAAGLDRNNSVLLSAQTGQRSTLGLPMHGLWELGHCSLSPNSKRLDRRSAVVNSIVFALANQIALCYAAKGLSGPSLAVWVFITWDTFGGKFCSLYCFRFSQLSQLLMQNFACG